MTKKKKKMANEQPGQQQQHYRQTQPEVANELARHTMLHPEFFFFFFIFFLFLCRNIFFLTEQALKKFYFLKEFFCKNFLNFFCGTFRFFEILFYFIFWVENHTQTQRRDYYYWPSLRSSLNIPPARSTLVIIKKNKRNGEKRLPKRPRSTVPGPRSVLMGKQRREFFFFFSGYFEKRENNNEKITKARQQCRLRIQ
jgi:hypothetical protein